MEEGWEGGGLARTTCVNKAGYRELKDLVREGREGRRATEAVKECEAGWGS